MAETILTPGKEDNPIIEQTSTPNYLLKDNLLSEFSTEAEKSVARYNLGVLASEDVYTKEEVEPIIIEKVVKKISEHLDSSDHITQSQIFELLTDLVKNDGSTPFIKPQSGVDPISNHDLTTKIYVDRLIQNCLKTADKAKILEEVAIILRDYSKKENTYTKNEVYTKDQIDDQMRKYMKVDGTTSFQKPVSGKTPQIGSHLATKGYVDTLMDTHKGDIDPHGFIEKLNNKLKKYVRTENVYDKTQTYSRGQIDSIIDKLVSVAVDEALKSHMDLNDPHGIQDKIKELGCILRNGSVAFTAPQKGVDAVESQDLVTLHQLLEKTNQSTWLTSGPVKTTVGFVEDNTELTKRLSLQEIMDAIFYGKGISLTIPETGNIGEPVDVTMCVHGSLATMDYGELYQNGKLLGTFTKEDFEESSCITVPSDVIMEDTEFIFRLFHIHGISIEEKATLKVAYPIFIGILPKWKFGNTLTYDYLKQLSQEDSVNNKFWHCSYDIGEITHKYNFEDPKLQHIFIVVPTKSNELYQMYTPSQQFSKDAFDIIDMIPFKLPGISTDTIYKVYIYKQALSTLNIPVTFKFE